MSTKPIIALITLSLSLSACATSNGNFPSLSKRPYEQSDPIAQIAPPPPQLTTRMPERLSAQTDQLRARNRNAVAAYVRAMGGTQSAVQSASGAATGSENWVQAHMILSRLDAARADSVAALADADRLIENERNQGADAGLVALLAQVQSQIAESVNEQNRDISRFHAAIGR